MKCIKKARAIQLNQVDNTIQERLILEEISNPFVIKLEYAFQTESSLIFVFEYCPGGELFFYLKNIGRFKESAAKFYAANMVLALKYLH